MKNILIVAGGAGAKIAGAVLNILALGVLNLNDGGNYKDNQDELEIWRIDRGGHREDSLKECLANYLKLQKVWFNEGDESLANDHQLPNHWAMKVVPEITEFDVVRPVFQPNYKNSLQEIFNKKEKEEEIIKDAFYESNDLNYKFDNGFEQRPHIGAAVMAIFAESLIQKLQFYKEDETRFFLCGNLFGATGVSAITILGKLLRKENKEWKIGTCILFPYSESQKLKASQTLHYCSETLEKVFDEVYLVGNTELKEINNLKKPIELIGALCSLKFFRNLAPNPAPNMEEINIEFEKGILAASILVHLIKVQILWDLPPKAWPMDPGGLKELYRKNLSHYEMDKKKLSESMDLTSKIMRKVVNSENLVSQSNLEENLKRKSNKEITWGILNLKLTAHEFYEWNIEVAIDKNKNKLDRYKYAKAVWKKIYTKIQATQDHNSEPKLYLTSTIKDFYHQIFGKSKITPAGLTKNLPTIWEQEFQFHQAINLKDESIIQEWASIFLLFYYRRIYLKEISFENIRSSKIISVLKNTYPFENEITEVKLLLLDQETAIGVYYPEVLFCPIQNRALWQKKSLLQPFLQDSRLSWEKCCAIFLPGEKEKSQFYLFLRRIIESGELSEKAKEAMKEFCDKKFAKDYPKGFNQKLPKDLKDWAHPEPNPQDMLKKYPLRKPICEDGYIYFLVNNNEAGWVNIPIEPGFPAPSEYIEGHNPHTIEVSLQGNPKELNLGEKDKVIKLQELFIPGATYITNVPKKSITEKDLVHRNQKIIDFIEEKNKETICLVPIRSTFFLYFQEFLEPGAIQKINAKCINKDEGKIIEWTFSIKGKEVIWRTPAQLIENLMDNPYVLWPPEADPCWHFYVASGVGKQNSLGRWHLVDENGKLGELVDQAEDEYISILYNDSDDQPNQPRALVWKNECNQEGGVLFLDIPNRHGEPLKNANLAVDCGNSNTSLAFQQTEGGSPTSLNFTLLPLKLFGEDRKIDRLGFIPLTKWKGERGYFATILMVKKLRSKGKDLFDSLQQNEIKPEHYFSACIPNLYEGVLSKYENLKDWRWYRQLKWGETASSIYRTVFLRLILLYAHAELFFAKGQIVHRYIFTFPLAFSESDQNNFHEQNSESIKQVRKLCYGLKSEFNPENYEGNIDESTAVAAERNLLPDAKRLELFIDIGGGTADIAIRYKDKIVLKDSIRLAGRQFFEFTNHNLDTESNRMKGSDAIRRLLEKMLSSSLKDPNLEGQDILQVPFIKEAGDKLEALEKYYLLRINDIELSDLYQREAEILKETKAQDSYQTYRTALFFRHILAYGLVQACAITIEKELSLTDGIELILSGNAWGLMLFAGFNRSNEDLNNETISILEIIKEQVKENLTEKQHHHLSKLKICNVELLIKDDLARGKTCVPRGALIAVEKYKSDDENPPFAGLNIQINQEKQITINWSDRWSKEGLEQKATEAPDNQRQENVISNSLLTVFIRIGNQKDLDQDIMPQCEWNRINSHVIKQTQCEINKIMEKDEQQKYTPYTPLAYFLSGLLYGDQLKPTHRITADKEIPNRFLKAMSRGNRVMDLACDEDVSQ